MKIRNLLLAGLMPILAWSCSEDALQGGGTTTPEAASKKYMEVSIKMPATTRTTTGDPMGTEPGKDYENAVHEVLVVVLNSDDKNSEGDICFVKSVKTAANSDVTTEGVHTGSSTSTVTARINNVILETEPSNYYIVYAFINPTQEMVEKYKGATGTGWKDFYEQAATGATVTNFINLYAHTTNGGRFFMTDTGADAKLSQYESKKAATFVEEGTGSGEYKLSTTVKVERAVARFDYKAHNEYNIYYFPLDQDGNEPTATDADLAIKLEGYKLMNVSKSFYHLRRVTEADGTAASEDPTDIIYGGLETVNNYVVDCDWTQKKDWLKEPNADGEFEKRAGLFFTPLNPPVDAPKSVDYTLLEDLKEQDNDEYKNKDYYIMGYCTENTIPSIAGQLSGISTAMVFEAKVSGSLMEKADMDALYEYNGEVYNKWGDFKKAWNDQHEGGDKIDDEQEKEPTGNDLKAFKEKIDGQVKRIPILGGEGDKHGYVYYIYRNRHNDNGAPAVMGPMEFAVVRNNIYKLTVSKIAKLGYTNDPTEPPTTDPEPEVDPPTPDLPDEDSKAYMEVTVNILNWTVRENEIEF